MRGHRDGMPGRVVEVRVGGFLVKTMGDRRPAELPLAVQAEHWCVGSQPSTRSAAMAAPSGEVVQIAH